MIEINIDLQKIGIGGEFRRFNLEDFALLITAKYERKYLLEVIYRENDRAFVFNEDFYKYALENNCFHDLDRCAREFAEKNGYKYFIKITDVDSYCIICAKEREEY
jgi:hypothetical protein